MLMRIFQRLRERMAQSHPLELESWVRGLLIQYHFHISDRRRIEIEAPGRNLNLFAPTVFKGEGRFILGATATFGVARSPGNHSCSYIEARTPQSWVRVGDGSVVNNRAVIMSEGAGIDIGKRVLIGTDFQCMDSNFHQLALGQRHLPDQSPRPVVVEDDVFIGSSVTLLKGCRIGRGSIISAGCVVPPSFVVPPLSVVAGNPARIVGQVEPEPQPLASHPHPAGEAHA